MRDAVYFGDVNSTDTWDAVWQGAAAARPDGWSAEIEIPLSILRFPAAPEQTWGIWVRRTIPRTHQLFESNLISRNANGFVSRFGDLIGLVNLKPKRDIELVPYLAARRFGDPSTRIRLVPTRGCCILPRMWAWIFAPRCSAT